MVELSSELGDRSECVYKSLRTPAQWQLVKGGRGNPGSHKHKLSKKKFKKKRR